MALNVYSLDGRWEVLGFAPGEVEPRLALSGQVPGQVHVDLAAEGIIPDPFWRDQAEQCQWVETWEWRYRRTFHVSAGLLTGWDVLQFEGLDTFAEVFLNGRRLGQAANMFVPHWFEVGGLVEEGENRVEVCFAPPARALADRPMDGYPSCFSSDRVYARKMQCSYGWDWVHRFVTAGIWRPVQLACYDRARIDDVFVQTTKLDDDWALLNCELTVERRTNEAVVAHVDILDPLGRCISSHLMDVLQPTLRFPVSIQQPDLWWPNGSGGQPLYACRVRLTGPEDAELDTRTVSFGIRTVEIEQIPDKRGSSFAFRVNGERIFARGGNWVPADAFPARLTKARYSRLLGLARDAHVNMLRAWGGGIYEPEPFWQACNRMGIMVIQDFLLACAQYPEQDPGFLEMLRGEFRQAIRALRNHPALVLWSGNNELGMNSDPDTDFCGRRIAQEVSEPLCRELDPTRPYLPTSPYGGSPNNSADAGDCHRSAWYDGEFQRSSMRDYRRRIARFSGRFLSESAVPGAPPLRSLLKFMAAEDLVDPEAVMWEYRTKDNPYNGIEDLTHFRMLERTAELLFGETLNPHAKVQHMEYVQYEWIRLTTEALRCNRACNGLLFWMYNDAWPASGWSVVDYYGFGKAGYYAMKRAFQPVIAALRPSSKGARVSVCNDGRTRVACGVTTRFQPWSGEPEWVREEEVEVAPGSTVNVVEIPRNDFKGQGVLVCDVEAGDSRDRAVFYHGMPREMGLPTALLRTTAHQGNGREGFITVGTDCYARVVSLEADLDFSDNYFDLLPGEERTIRWWSPQGVFSGIIPVRCWNGGEHV